MTQTQSVAQMKVITVHVPRHVPVDWPVANSGQPTLVPGLSFDLRGWLGWLQSDQAFFVIRSQHPSLCIPL
ncbi:hypothetical protein J4Q44_G00021200 [Coregonus suidteri]|uniref:Uncharacterized protein n=1 Tax=Coregonus suidteri TaxID=861788 RepID=A0AAN8M7M2_9TELE